MRTLGLWLALLPNIGAAWDQTPIAISAPEVAPKVVHLASAANGGFHAVVRHRDSILSVDRYTPDGRRLTRIFEPVARLAGGDLAGARRVIDFQGSALTVGTACSMAKVGDDVIWRSELLMLSSRCLPAITPSGGVWLSHSVQFSVLLRASFLTRYDSMGRLVLNLELYDTIDASSNPVVDSEGAVSLGGSDASVRGRSVVINVRADGTTRWRWQADAADGGRFSWLLPRAAGGVLAFGSLSDGSLSADPLTILSLSGAGEPIASRAFDEFSGNQIQGVVGDSESRFALIAKRRIGSSSTAVLVPDASAPFDLPTGFECIPSDRGCALRLLDNGDVELPLRNGVQTRLLRISRTGQLLSERIIPLEQQVTFAVPQTNEGWWLLSGDSLQRVAIDGSTRPFPIEPAALSLPSVAEFQRGDVRLLVLDDGGKAVLARVNARGTVLWQRAFANTPSVQLTGNRALAIADGAACFAGQAQVYCLRLSDGATALEVPTNAAIGAQFGVFADGTLAVVDRNLEGGAEVRRWRIADAQPLPRVVLPMLRVEPAGYLQLRDDRYGGGSMVVIGRSSLGAVLAAWFDNDDTASRNFTLPHVPLDFIVDRQYLALINERIGGGTRRLNLRALDTALDREQMDEELDVVTDADGRVAHLVIGDGNRFVSLASELLPRSERIVSVTPDWRTLLWSKRERAPAIGYLYDSRRLLLARDEGAALAFVMLDNEGNRVDAKTLPCETGSRCFSNLHRQGEFATDVSVAFNRYQANDGRQLRSGTIRLGATPDVPLSQPGLAGPWFHPGIPGQGFMVSYIPETKFVFAPWFAYIRGVPRGGQSALSWYYLRGTVAAGATRADLEIVRNVGGRFAAPPVTAAEVVGRAELRLSDCDRATLSYAFNTDVEFGLSGSMPLVRLGPRLQPCLRTDGTTLATATMVADSNGFSQRQSGAWFEPASSGQGLMFEVQPARAGDAGFVFGAWFTYDVPPGNDSTQQDWFTLQAPLEGASGGRIELPILRVIGGELDRTASSSTFRVGMATLTFVGCDRAVFQFQFDSNELAAEHSGRSGMQQLQRAGGCGPN